MKKSIFFSFFVFCFFCLIAESAFAYGEPDEIDLIGPQWAVDMVCGEIHNIFPSARLTQIVREGKTSLQFKKNRITYRVIPVSLDALVRPGRVLSDEALALIEVWQTLVPAYEYRRGCTDNPWPRYSSGSQVWAKAPLAQRVHEIADKSGDQAKPKTVVCGDNICKAYFCSPNRVPMATAIANLPTNAVKLWGEEDGSNQPVTTVGLWVEAQ